MRIPSALRETFRTPAGLFAFFFTCMLLAASLYPLYIMVRTAFQAVGDPLEGTPSEIMIARGDGGPFTLQNQPMFGGTWDDVAGFERIEDAWEEAPAPNTMSASAPNAAYYFSWEGDLRRFRRLLLEESGTQEGWRIAWQNINGDIAMQELSGSDPPSVRPSSSLAVSLPADRRGVDFDPIQITGFVLVAPAPAAQWSLVVLEPRAFTFVNFTNVWKADSFSRYTFNSLLVAFFVTFGSVVTSLCAGYAFARSAWRFRTVFWVLLVGSMLIPSQVLLIPAFLIIQHFPLFGGNDLFGQGGIGLLDSYTGLILPNMVMPLGIFLVRQSLLSMPDSYEEAAVIDGASIWQLLRLVIAPLLRPILATVALLAFLFNWNSFIFPLILIQTPEMRTLPVGLALYSARNEVDWVHLMAASTITALPIFLLFIFFQRQLISGLVHEGVKG
ncbi:MAG: carbohydrate ABC transporter permease [Candidatus Sumerlaeia bacterium]|nr:carbohydrate ABC transporter permease [Candidatus Sumerlaeia bacterium]